MPLYDENKNPYQETMDFYDKQMAPQPTEEDLSKHRFGLLEKEYERLKVDHPDRDPYVLEKGMEAIRQGPIAPYNYPTIDELEQVGNEWIEANEPGYGEVVGKGIMRGIEGLAGGVGSLTRWAGEATGLESVARVGKEASEYWRSAQQEGIFSPDRGLYRGTFMENPSFKRAVGIVAEAVPSLGAALMTGGAGVAAGLSRTAASWLAGTSLALLEGGPQYEEAREAGKSVTEASVSGLASTAGTAILESLAIGKFLGLGKKTAKVAGKAGRLPSVRAAGKGMMIEGMQESSQQIWQNLVAKMGYEPTRDLAEGLVEAFIGGAGAGGIAGGTVAKLNQIVDKAKDAGVSENEIDNASHDLKTEINGKAREDALVGIRNDLASGAMTIEDVGAIKDQYPELQSDLNEIISEHTRMQIERRLKDAEKAGRATEETGGPKGFEGATERLLRLWGLEEDRMAAPEREAEEAAAFGKDAEALEGEHRGLSGYGLTESPIGKSAEESAMAMEQAFGTEERIRQSAAYVDVLKQQLKEKSEKSKSYGLEGRVPYIREYLRRLKGGEPGGLLRTEDYDGTQEWTGYGSTYPGWFQHQGWGRDKAVSALEKGLSGKPFAPSERGTGEESIWEAALIAAEEERNKGYIEYAAEIEENPELISGMPLDEYQLMLGVLEDEKFYTGPVKEASALFRKEVEDEAVETVSGELGISEEEFRSILENPEQPAVSLDQAWDDLSVEDRDFMAQWDRERSEREARRGQPRSAGEVLESVEGAPQEGVRPSRIVEAEKPTPPTMPEKEKPSPGSEIAPKEAEIEAGEGKYHVRYESGGRVTANVESLRPIDAEAPISKDKFISDLKAKGVARAGDVTYKILRNDPLSTYYLQKTEGGVRVQSGPGAPAQWSFGEAIDRAVQEAQWSFGEAKESLTVPEKAEKPSKPEPNHLEELKSILKSRESLTLEGEEYALDKGFARRVTRKGKYEGKLALTSAGIKEISKLKKKPTKPLTKQKKEVKLEIKEEPKKAAEMSADELLAEWDRQAEETEPQAEPAPEKILIKSVRTGVTVDTIDVKPTAKQKAKEASEHIASAIDKFKQINEILGEKGEISDKEVDQAKWDLIRPLLKEAWNDIVSAGKAGADFVKLAMANLSPKGRPYFEKFVREEIGGKKHGEGDVGESGRVGMVEPEGDVDVDVSPGDNLGDISGEQAGPIRPDQGRRGERGGIPEGLGAEEPTGSRPDLGTGVEPSSPEGRGGKGPLAGETASEDLGVGRRSTGKQKIHEADRNHIIEEGDVIVPPGPESRIQGNIEAIQLVKKLQSKDRNPTTKEKKILAKYVGWGAFSQKVFNRDFSGYVEKWMETDPPEQFFGPDNLKKYNTWATKYGKKLHPKLGGALTQDEWNSARASTINAHYTSREVINPMWDIAKRLGFKGGTVLEPAGGVGHFFGLMPQDLAEKSILYGIEKDTISGLIFQKLYPQADIEITSFEKSKRVLDNSMDLVISNFPFANIRISDKKHPDYSGWSLHNYFFGRSLSAAKPGGVVLAITSAWTMDAQSNGKIREYLAGKADLLGVIRLPNTAFKKNAGTDVVTDIIVLRKKSGEKSGQGEDFRTTQQIITPKDEKIINAYDRARANKNDTDKLKIPKGANKHEKEAIKKVKAKAKEEVEKAYKEYNKIYSVNEYFIKHPDMVLGKHSKKGSMYAADTYTVEPTGDLKTQLSDAISKFPTDIMGEGTDLADLVEEKFADASAKEGVLLMEGTKVYLVENGRMVTPYYMNSKGTKTEITEPTKIARLKKYIEVRDVTKKLVDVMAQPGDKDAEIAKLQRELNWLYDGYVKKYKAFGTTGNSFIRKTDNEFAIVDALEIKKSRIATTGKNKSKEEFYWIKQDIFTERTIYPFVEPSTAENLEDAVNQSIIYKGEVNPFHIAKLLGQTDVEQVKKDIVANGYGFVNPDTGLLEQKDLYLSGNVKRKLAAAKRAAESNPSFKTNVEHLEKVIPEDLDMEFISFRLGSGWIPDAAVEDFMAEVLGLQQGDTKTTVRQIKSDETSRWKISDEQNVNNVKNTKTWGTEDYYASELVEMALNFKIAKVMRPVDDPHSKATYEDKEASKEANLKMTELSDEFVRWAKTHDKWSAGLAKQYNEEKNGIVLRKHSAPDIKYYPNASRTIELRPHQKIAVSRGLQESALLAYGVGTGKTYIYITLSQEMKRIGTARKPLIVAHNATIDQYRESFALLYPSAKVLIPNEGQRSRAQRKKLLTSMATGNWDAIVLPHSFFNGLANDPKREAAYVEERIAELEDELIEAQADNDDPWNVKELEKTLEKKKQHLGRLLDRRKDQELFFEQMGIDALLIDEAHSYKRSEFFTKMNKVKGIDSGSAQKSTSFLLKANFVREKTGGKNVITATGTPISNTMAELWTMLRYVRPDLLKEYGVSRFDDFAGAFGNVIEGLEETPSGFKEVSRFAKYINGPELLTMFFSGADVRLTKDANLKLPKIKGGKPTAVVVEKSPELRSFISDIIAQWRAWEKLPGREKMKNRHVPLTLYGQAKKAAVDLRLIDPSYYKYDPSGKLGRAIENIHRVWKESKEDRSTQIVFLDVIRDDAKNPRFNSHSDLKKKLIEKGIPKEEILIFSEAKNESQQETYKNKIRTGEARVVIGSTEKLGIGVDLANKLLAAHHLNVPDRPMDIEQRNGRILRQGNMNEEIEIFHYMTKDTLDSVMFDRLAKKQRFADQVLTGDIDGRTFNDPFSEEEASFSEFAAAASGEAGKLLFEKNELISQEHKYRVAENAYIRQASEARRGVRRIPLEIEEEKAKLKGYESLQGDLEKEFPEMTLNTVTYKGKEFDRKDFAKELEADIEAVKAKLEKTYGGMKFGDYRKALEAQGKKLYEEVSETLHAKAGSVEIRVHLEAVTNHRRSKKPGEKIEFLTTWDSPQEPPIISKPQFSYTKDKQTLWSTSFRNIPSRFTSSFNKGLKGVASNIAATKESIAKLEKAFEDMETLSKQKFKYGNEIKEARRRIKEIDAELIDLDRAAQEKERAELAAKEEDQQTQLSLAPKEKGGGGIAQAREANPEALEELRKDVRGWLRDVLPKSALKRIDLELTPKITRKGKNVKLSEKEHADLMKANISERHDVPPESLEFHAVWDMPEIGQTVFLFNVTGVAKDHPKFGSTLAFNPEKNGKRKGLEISGATTTNALRSFIEISYNFDNDSIQESAYHEAYHVAKKWLLPDKDLEVLSQHFENEEAEAYAFQKFARGKKDQERQPSFIKRIFRKLRLMFKRLRNGFLGKNQKSPQDVFEKLWGKEYELIPEQEIARRAERGETGLQVQAWQGGPAEVVGGYKDEFIGSGEGAQAFGWGHYFTDLEDIARGYSELGNAPSEADIDNMSEIIDYSLDWSERRDLAQFLEEQGAEIWGYEDNEVVRHKLQTFLGRELDYEGKMISAFDDYSSDIAEWMYDAGWVEETLSNRHLHKVTIHKGKSPSEYEWLDWDKPIPYDQKKKIDSQAKKEFGDFLLWDIGQTGQNLYRQLSDVLGSPKDASAFLLRSGIDGNRYPAGSLSGMKDRGAKNYVVFDPNAVTIDEHTRFSLAGKQTPEQWARVYMKAYVDAQPKAKRPAIEETIAKEEKAFDKEHTKDTVGLWDTIKKIPTINKTGWKEGKTDVKSWQRLLSVPAHFFHEIEALGRVYNDGLENVDNRHMILDGITMASDGHYYTAEMDTFRKEDKVGYRELKKYLKHRDQNQIGYSIAKNVETGGWDLFDIKKQDTPIGTFQGEQQAAEAMIQAEANDYRKTGASDQAVEALIAARRITNNGFDILFQAMRELEAYYKETGQELPTEAVNVDGKAVTVSLKLALAKMGSMRGYYMPRIRKPGRFVGYAKKKGVHPIRQHFDTKTMLNMWQAKMEGQGYTVTKDLQKRMPEDVFEMAGQVVAQEAIINEALQRIRTKKFTLEDFGLKAVDRSWGPGKRDFMVTGPAPKALTPVFKKLGGKWYSSEGEGKGGPRVWHFQNPGAYFENRLAKAIALEKAAVDVDTGTRAVFAKALVEQVSNIIKGRGVRAHMIARADAKGIDVWEGYEEDPGIALAKYARGISAGEAKKIMARDMLAHFTGTDISWREFQNLEGEDVTYEDYLNFVDDRRVDPVNQSNAFKEGKTYIEHMLRNEEAIDRLTGTIKGLAVLKYLGGRISAPLVNLTALVTSVPASMEGFGKIPLHKTFKYLAKAGILYGTYKFGNKEALTADIRLLFDEIHNKGWHNAQYNREALAVLRGKAGRGWDKLIDWSMIGFGVTEQLNRVSTIAGAYLGLKAQGQKDHDTMMSLSKKISDQAHATYGKANYPLIARGSHPAANVMKAFYVFKTFSHNYMLTMKDLWGEGWTPKNGKAFSYMALSPAILAGAGGVVGWDLIMKAMAMAFGLDDPEDDMYNWLEANVGDYAENLARFGGFGLIGMNLKGSLEIGVTDLPTSWKDMLGAPGSVISDFYEGGKSIIKGDINKGIEKMSPLAVAGPFKAYREATEGLTTRTNAPIFYGRQRVKADMTDAILRSLSFNPAGIAKVREQKWAERRQEGKYSDRRRDIYSKIKKFMLQPVEDRSKSDWAEILEEIREYNNRVKGKKLVGIVPFITQKSIKTNLRRSLRPTKREIRRRAVNE